jgi:hypothetical protein
MVTVHHADFHADLIDENYSGQGFADYSGQLSQCLGHESGIMSEMNLLEVKNRFI